MPATRQRHPLDDVLVANLRDVHHWAWLLAQAKRPQLSAICIRKRSLKIGRRFLDHLVSKSESSHRLHCSGRRRIPRTLIHGFAIEATRLVRDGMADTFAQDALAAGDAFLGVSLTQGLPHRRRFACAADRRQTAGRGRGRAGLRWRARSGREALGVRRGANP